MTSHTPGPWQAEHIDTVFHISGAIFEGAKRAVVEVADVWVPDGEHGVEAQAANAKLIQAAPDLLAALKRLSFAAQTSGGTAGRDRHLVAAIDQAAAAIAKATP